MKQVEYMKPNNPYVEVTLMAVVALAAAWIFGILFSFVPEPYSHLPANMGGSVIFIVLMISKDIIDERYVRPFYDMHKILEEELDIYQKQRIAHKERKVTICGQGIVDLQTFYESLELLSTMALVIAIDLKKKPLHEMKCLEFFFGEYEKHKILAIRFAPKVSL